MHNRQRNHDRPRPRRHLVDQPPQGQHPFRRNRRRVLPRIQPENAEVYFDVAVRCLQSTHRQDTFPQPAQIRIVVRQPGKLQRRVSLHRSANLGRPLRVNIEAAIRQLSRQNRPNRAPDTLPRRRIPHTIDRRMPPQLQQNIIGFQRRVGSEISPPIPICDAACPTETSPLAAVSAHKR